MNKTGAMTRRVFGVKVMALGAGTVLASVPFARTAIAEASLRLATAPAVDLGYDPILGNLPHYVEAVPFEHVLALHELPQLADSQWC